MSLTSYLLPPNKLTSLNHNKETLVLRSNTFQHRIHFQAITEKKYKSAKNLSTISLGITHSPFGRVVIARSDLGICEMSYCDAEGDETILSRLKKQWHRSTLIRDDKLAKETVDRIFSMNKSSEDVLPICVLGTEFRIAVWRALLTIPCGSLVSYGDIANAIGNPKAVRAVGSSVGANPVSLLIPCHRVIRGSGDLGGYRGGLERKRKILSQELGYSF